MSQEAVERTLGRLITDCRFRSQATDSLESACIQEGYKLSRDELLLLSDLEMQDVITIASRLNPGLCRARS